jgi:hypothetical protein
VLFSGLLGILLVADAWNIVSEIHQVEDFRNAGGSVIVLTAPHMIDGASCDRLRNLPGIRASGAVVQLANGLEVPALPDAEIPTFAATPGIAEIVKGRSSGPGGIILSQELAEQLVVGPGDSITTNSGLARVSQVFPYPSDGRLPILEYAALMPSTSAGTFDSCWADIWPPDSEKAALLRTAIVPSVTAVDNSIELRQLNSTVAPTAIGYPAYEARVTAAAGSAGVVLSWMLGSGVVWLRRLEIASALHAGVKKGALLVQVALEMLAGLLPGAILTFPAIAVTTRSVGATDRIAIWEGALLLALLSLASGVIGGLASVISIRESSLFRYFKER